MTAEAFSGVLVPALTPFNSDLDPDEHDGFKNGVHGIFDRKDTKRSPDAWGTIAAWAWGASRTMDYFESDPDIDASKMAVVGHSGFTWVRPGSRSYSESFWQ